jgi:YegS/Rv2252/BmrU family lipid kinase
MRILLLYNPRSGGAADVSPDFLVARILAHGDCQTLLVSGDAAALADAASRARREGFDRVIVAGGDGTINLAASELLDSGVPLGIVPTGTANVMARELGVPLDPAQAINVALAGEVRAIDAGTANGRPFVLNAGLGFDAQVVAELVPRLKALFGPLAYITSGINLLLHYEPSLFTIEGVCDEPVQFRAWMMAVGNAGHYAYDLVIAPDAHMDDGLLDVVVFTEHGGWDRLATIGAVLAGYHVGHPHLVVFRAARLRITATPPVYLQLDGDPGGATPVDIEVLPGALQVVGPRRLR